MMPKLLALAGSIRNGSFNQSLIHHIANVAGESGADVTVVDPMALDLPLFNQDLEARDGLPPAVVALKNLMADHDGLIIASPEYNSSITPLLKNAIDWCSRAASDNEPPMAAYRGKSALLVSASPGGFGGMRALNHLRDIMMNINVAVFPKMFSLGSAHQAFDDSGSLTAPDDVKRVESLVAGYLAFAASIAE